MALANCGSRAWLVARAKASGSAGEDNVLSGAHAQPPRRRRRGHHGLGQRHRLQHLVRHALSDAQRRHGHSRMRQERAHVRHCAGQGEAQPHGAATQAPPRPPPDHHETQVGTLGAQPVQHVPRKPQCGILVRPISHVAGEGDHRTARSERAWQAQLRREMAAVDAVRDHHGPVLRTRQSAAGRPALRPARRTGSGRTAPAQRDRTRATGPARVDTARTRASAGMQPSRPICRSRRRRSRRCAARRAPARTAGTAPSPPNRRKRTGSAAAASGCRPNRRALRRRGQRCSGPGCAAGHARSAARPALGAERRSGIPRTGFADGPRGASRRDRRRSIPDGRRDGARGVPGSDRRGSCRPWWAGRGCDARETGSPPIGSPEAAGDQRAERVREGQRQAPPERDPKGILGIERVHIGQL